MAALRAQAAAKLQAWAGLTSFHAVALTPGQPGRLLRVVSAPPQDEKCPHLLKVATRRILWAKSLAGGERWCRIAPEPSK